jgi:hypothetical protein
MFIIDIIIPTLAYRLQITRISYYHQCESLPFQKDWFYINFSNCQTAVTALTKSMRQSGLLFGNDGYDEARKSDLIDSDISLFI